MPTITRQDGSSDDPFLSEHPDKAIAISAAAAARRQETGETRAQARTEDTIEPDLELPAPNEDGLVETDSFTFIPSSLAASAVDEDVDKVLGLDQYGNEVLESEYLADPDAFEFVETPTPSTSPVAASVLPDSIIGIDGDGNPVRASEYYSNPESFTIAQLPDPVVAITADGSPVKASQYYSNPAAFQVVQN